MAGIYDYINRFWAEAERNPFNPTEVALYHYLLYEANRLRWNMPFACWKIQCKLPPKTKRFCPLVLK